MAAGAEAKAEAGAEAEAELDAESDSSNKGGIKADNTVAGHLESWGAREGQDKAGGGSAEDIRKTVG